MFVSWTKVLDVFNTSFVMSILYVVITTFVILTSAVLFLLPAFKDLNVSNTNFPKVRRDGLYL